MTTWADFCAAIRDDPADTAARLIAADWLREHDDCDRADFIRCQVESAKDTHHYCQADSCVMNYGQPCPFVALRRHESELLSATHAEPCDHCGGGRPGKWMYAENWRGQCSTCRGKHVVQVSNAVRWAGKLGGREPVVSSNGWHVGWLGPSTTLMSNVLARFESGFLSTVSLSCAALVGEKCRNCGPGREATELCLTCNGNGYTSSGCLAELATGEQFAGLMPGGVVLSDKRPQDRGDSRMRRRDQFGWFADPEHEDQYHIIPRPIWELLEDATRTMTGNWKWYASAALAVSALSSAVFALLRSVRTKQEAATCELTKNY